MKTILLFTEGFPLKGITEGAFVRPELGFLSQNFERVFIIPGKSNGEENHIDGSAPRNVFVETGYSKTCGNPVTVLDCIRHPVLVLKAIFGNRALYLKKADLFARVSAARFDKWISEFLAQKGLCSQDVVLYSFWLTAEAEFIGDWRKRHPMATAISRAHRFDIFDAWRTNFRKRALMGLQGVYPCSEDGSSVLREQYPVLADRIKTAYLGVPAAESLNPVPQDDRMLTFFSCHNLIERKRGALCARMLIELARRLPDWKVRWILIGDGPEREQICVLARDATTNFELDWRGALPNAEVRKICATEPIDFAILLSSSEGLAVMEQEALSYGIPVVSTDVGGARECVNKETGLLLSVDVTADGFISSIIPILSRRCEMRDAARRMWAEKFDSRKTREEFVRDVMNTRRGRD